MKNALCDLIRKFNKSQSYVISVLKRHGINNPSSDVEWSGMQISDDIKDNLMADGIKVFKHGYGLSFKDASTFIDFDFGANGEIDGFDANRLWNYVQANKIECQWTSAAAVEHAIKNEELLVKIRHSGYINYYWIAG